MRIAMAVDTYFPRISGVASAVRNQIKQLGKMGHDVILFAPEFKDYQYHQHYHEQEENVIRVPSVRLPVDKETNALSPVAAKKVMFQHLDRFQPEIIHSQTEWLAARYMKRYAMQHKIPSLVSFRTNWWEYHKIYFKLFNIFSAHRQEKIIDYILRWVFRGFDCVVPLTESFRRMVLDKQLHTCAEAIPSGLSSEEFYPSIGESKSLRQQFFLDHPELKDKSIFIYVARLSKEKNVEYLLEVMQEMVKSRKDIVMLIVGDGAAKQSLSEQSKAMGLEKQVTFTGYMNKQQIKKYLLASKIFVTASTSETQGNTNVEALSCGLPIVGLDSPGFCDVIKDEEGGFLVNSLEEFTRALHNLLDDEGLYQTKSAQARNRAEYFRDVRVAERFVKLYQKLILEFEKCNRGQKN